MELDDEIELREHLWQSDGDTEEKNERRDRDLNSRRAIQTVEEVEHRRRLVQPDDR